MARWVQVGLFKSVVSQILIPSSDSAAMFALGSLAGVQKSVDRGRTWIDVNDGLPKTAWGKAKVQGLAGAVSGTGAIYAGIGRLGQRGSEQSAGLYLLADGDSSWRGAGQDMVGKEVYLLATAGQPRGDRLMCVATANELYCSRNEGLSWERSRWRAMDVHISALAIDPHDPARIYLGTAETGLYASNDGGISWVPVNQGLDDASILDVAFSPMDARLAYVATGSGLYRTGDRGGSWEQVLQNTFGAIVLHPSLPNVVCAAKRHGGVLLSMDGGETWVRLATGMGELAIYALAFDPRDPTVLWAGTEDGIWKYVFDKPLAIATATVLATPPIARTAATPLTETKVAATMALPMPSHTTTPTSTALPSPSVTPTPRPSLTVTPLPSSTSVPLPTATSTPVSKPPAPTAQPPGPTKTPLR